MRIVAVREQTVALSFAARSSNIAFDGMTASAVSIETDVRVGGRPLVGLAFDTIGRYAHGGLLRERFIPRLLAADPAAYSAGDGIDPGAVYGIVMANEKFGGHGERCGAVGLLDAAAWDLAAKGAGVPLWALLAGREGRAADGRVAVYASGGHYAAEHDAETLHGALRRSRAAGHRVMKIKIGGAPLCHDMRRIEAALDAIGPEGRLALDANGAFDLDTARRYLRALAPLPIAWLEEPGTALDYDLNARIAAESGLPLAVGENLFSFDDARNLLRHGGLRPTMDLLQFDISASYGLTEYRRILDLFAAQGWSRARFAPHAGHLFAMHCAAGLGLGLAEVAMDAASLFGQITATVPVADGIAALPSGPGVGFEALPVFDTLFSDVLPQ
jgi:L-alanine-DL-glutamate epimerase-like enolase superfamily enzyme